MIRPGRRNLITDVPGLRVGNADDAALRSGVTVILPDAPAVAAADVRGGGPGTREIDLLDPSTLVDHIHAIVLSGGSAFGLAAADGAVSWLAEQGRGFEISGAIVPLVPAAILFDLSNRGDKSWGSNPPYRDLAWQAAEAATHDFPLGNIGAGMGATAGPLKGGLGSASLVLDDGLAIGALVAANPAGSVTEPGCGRFWAAPFEQAEEFGGRREGAGPIDLDYSFNSQPGANTTLAVVATDAALTPAQARRVAIMAHDGLARAIRPVHTPFDGDTVFVLSLGRRPLDPPADALARIGMLAADCVCRAIARAVYEAESLDQMKSYKEIHGA